MSQTEIAGYRWDSAELTCAHNYLLPAVLQETGRLLAKTLAGGGDCLSLDVAMAVLPIHFQSRDGT